MSECARDSSLLAAYNEVDRLRKENAELRDENKRLRAEIEKLKADRESVRALAEKHGIYLRNVVDQQDEIDVLTGKGFDE